MDRYPVRVDAGALAREATRRPDGLTGAPPRLRPGRIQTRYGSRTARLLSPQRAQDRAREVRADARRRCELLDARLAHTGHAAEAPQQGLALHRADAGDRVELG